MGTGERIHLALRERVRVRAGRAPTPRAGIIDSQSVKTTEQGGPPDTSGYDGGKQVKGRKRHLLVDTLSLVLRVLGHPADVPDQVGGNGS